MSVWFNTCNFPKTEVGSGKKAGAPIQTLENLEMKKTLVALAALAATSAFAQSSVTIYGQFDAGLYNIKKANAAGNTATVYGDGATFSNVLGFRGTEDMGAGLKAGFHLETDVQTNNGGENQNGQFRRQANGNIAGGFGEIKLGITTNPIIATNGALMPVSGNSVSTATSSAMGFADFYTKNAVTYTSPAIMGLTAQIQRGMSNNVESSSEGSVTAYSLAYVNGPLEVRYAAQDRKAAAAGTANSGANPSTPGSGAIDASTGAYTATAAAAAKGKESSVMGVKYKVGAWTVGAASLKTQTAGSAENSGSQMGVGYTTGAWTLGASLTKSEGSKLTNTQARYALSKRTNLIGMYATADNKATVKFFPVAFNTGSAPAAITDSPGGAANTKHSVIGLGLTHSF
ncbi:MAG: porin [Burkholderiaceae bacterium]